LVGDSTLEIDHCVFPDDLLYDTENNTWLRIDKTSTVTVGVTSILSAIAGRFVRAHLKPVGVHIERGQSLGTLESEKFVGPVPSPVTGVLLATNDNIVSQPMTVNSSPYETGWIARVKPSQLVKDSVLLSAAEDSRIKLAQKIAQLHVRCFKAFPDRELYEIGTECTAVIVRLNELLATMAVGEVVHLVSDDPTAYVEMVAWTDRSGQSLVDWRREGNLFHFIVKKVR
jgi:glycine cleavage system H protein